MFQDYNVTASKAFIMSDICNRLCNVLNTLTSYCEKNVTILKILWAGYIFKLGMRNTSVKVCIVGGIYFSIANAWDSIRRYLIALNSCTSINIYSYFSQCDLWNCGIKSQHMVSIILILLLSRCKLREFVQNADNFTLYLYRRCRNFVFFLHLHR